MRQRSIGVGAACVAGLLVAVAVQAAVVQVELPRGETIDLAVPGIDGVTQPTAIPGTMVTPLYPEADVPVGIDSSVTLAVLVLDDGSVGMIDPIDVQHPGMGFARAAMEAVAEWRFRPARDGKRRVHSFKTIKFNFRAPGSVPLADVGLDPLRYDRGLLVSSGAAAGVPATPALPAAIGDARTASGYRGPTRNLLQPAYIPRFGPGALYVRPEPAPARPRRLPAPVNVAPAPKRGKNGGN